MYGRLLILLCIALSSLIPCLQATPPSSDQTDNVDYWAGLSPRQREVLLSGEPILLEEEIKGKPWPRYIVYQMSKGTPAEVAAIFWDLRLDPKYIPNCLLVTILAKPSPEIVEGEYTLKMPFFLPDEVYVSRNRLRKFAPGDYEISWTVTRARYTKSAHGQIRLQEHDGSTLIRYSNLVEPGSRIAGIMKTSAGNQVVASVKALAAQVTSELGPSRELIGKQMRELEEATAAQTPVPSK